MLAHKHVEATWLCFLCFLHSNCAHYAAGTDCHGCWEMVVNSLCLQASTLGGKKGNMQYSVKAHNRKLSISVQLTNFNLSRRSSLRKQLCSSDKVSILSPQRDVNFTVRLHLDGATYSTRGDTASCQKHMSCGHLAMLQRSRVRQTPWR